MNYKSLFSTALKNNPNHFASHSHHPWPNVTEQAQQEAWTDANNRLDLKWSKIFSEVLPETRKFIADLLGGVSPDAICEGQNTFEILLRLMSSQYWSGYRRVKVLTTDSEFYSFKRLATSLKQNDLVELDLIPAEPFESFPDRFGDALKKKNYDFVYLSQVFFNSGFVATPTFERIKTNMKDAMVVIDGYHSLGALPVDFKDFENDFYFVGGGYKYLACGEACAFVHSPLTDDRVPMLTGWYAQINGLADTTIDSDKAPVSYPQNAQKWAGATFDPTPYYRMRAVKKLWQDNSISPAVIHQHVRGLQEEFLAAIDLVKGYNGAKLVGFSGYPDWGNFLAVQSANAKTIEEKLLSKGYYVDRRNDRVRFGFGIYHDTEDVHRLATTLKQIL